MTNMKYIGMTGEEIERIFPTHRRGYYSEDGDYLLYVPTLINPIGIFEIECGFCVSAEYEDEYDEGD